LFSIQHIPIDLWNEKYVIINQVFLLEISQMLLIGSLNKCYHYP
jgi:hypothetical protein